MIRSAIRTKVRDLLNEPTPGFWTDTQLNSYIDLANQRVNSIISTLRQDFFVVSATFNLTAGEKSYVIPSDCHYIRRLEIYDPADANNIIKIDAIQWPRIEAYGDWPFTQNGKPQRYTMMGNHIDIYPIPDAVYAMRIYYDVRDNDLSNDADAPLSPVDFHDMLVFWTCVLATKQNEEDDGGFGNLFNIRKAELIEMLIHREGDDDATVTAYLQGII